MRGLLVAACVLLAATGAARAEDVVCGKGWVSFTPYLLDTVIEAPGSVLIRKADIRQGALHHSGSREGVLRVTRGYGTGRNRDEIKVPAQTYRAIMRCLMGD